MPVPITPKRSGMGRYRNVACPSEVAWFAALCDDDYEFLGVPDPALRSSWEHCRDLVLRAERNGFDSVLLPSGYALGIDAPAFAAGIAPLTKRIRLLLAVRAGELWPPQLARQLATIDRMAGGRLDVNIISSDLPGAPLDKRAALPRARSRSCRSSAPCSTAAPLQHHGEFYDLELDPPATSRPSRAVPAVLLRRSVRCRPRVRGAPAPTCT